MMKWNGNAEIQLKLTNAVVSSDPGAADVAPAVVPVFATDFPMVSAETAETTAEIACPSQNTAGPSQHVLDIHGAGQS